MLDDFYMELAAVEAGTATSTLGVRAELEEAVMRVFWEVGRTGFPAAHLVREVLDGLLLAVEFAERYAPTSGYPETVAERVAVIILHSVDVLKVASRALEAARMEWEATYLMQVA